MSAIVPMQGDALLIVDLQVDFLPGGQLAVPHGDRVLAPIARLVKLYGERGLPIYASRDWHPQDHCSFVEQGGPWPAHCVRDTAGAAFAAQVPLPAHTTIVSKATERDQDAYSAFNGTHLARWLAEHGVRRLAVCGLATDYCVLNSVVDACNTGIEVLLVTEAIAAVDVTPGDGDRAITQMLLSGAVPVCIGEDTLMADLALGARP